MYIARFISAYVDVDVYIHYIALRYMTLPEIHACLHTHTYIHACIHTYIHTYTHTRMCIETVLACVFVFICVKLVHSHVSGIRIFVTSCLSKCLIHPFKAIPGASAADWDGGEIWESCRVKVRMCRRTHRYLVVGRSYTWIVILYTALRGVPKLRQGSLCSLASLLSVRFTTSMVDCFQGASVKHRKMFLTSGFRCVPAIPGHTLKPTLCRV